ncbi:hypothetical protein HZA98_00130 [Candidatus Woesearchaeota archaeon]|nr:hypothetical protein [Candidatus Woesearchaeota archaeon]
MSYIKGVLLFSVVLLVLPFVFASNGCCGQSVSGDTCVYTSSENCATADSFSSYSCEGTAFCSTGCCVTSDGNCGENTGQYTCAAASGEFFSGQSCDAVSSCAKTCCENSGDFSYTSTAACDSLKTTYGDSVVEHSVSSEQECYDLGHGSDSGCCVTQDSTCAASTQEACGSASYDSGTGYGFYPSESCSSVASYLADKSLEAAANCACQSEESLNSCDTLGRVVSSDTCGNQESVVEDCAAEGKVCSTSSGKATCDTGTCASTYSFPPGSLLENFNSYPVYYQSGISSWDKVALTLGGARKHGESWCVYESPVGSFKDRVGSQHYLASCLAGQEYISNCESDRSQMCVTTYDPVEKIFHGECVANDFATTYGVDPASVGDTYAGLVSPDATTGEYTDSASTVAPETSDYCTKATFDCETIYGQSDVIPDDELGWELYVNAYCLRKEFALTAADYCASRGNCGIKENVAGKYGGVDSFKVSADPAFEDVHVIGCGGDCFDRRYVPDNNYALSEATQCLGDREKLLTCEEPWSMVDDSYQNDWGDAAAENGDISPNFLTEQMRPYWLHADEVAKDSGAISTDCISPYQRVRSIFQGLGTNIYPGDWYSLSSEAEWWGNGVGSPVGGCGSDAVENCADEAAKANDEDVPYRSLFNTLRSVKPWFMDLTALHPFSIAAGDNTHYNDFKYLTLYDGDTFGCDASTGPWTSDWFAAYDNADGFASLKDINVNFDCAAWQAPSGGEDCSLCDTPVSQGGLIFDQGDTLYPASYCNKFRCQSLGSSCTYVGDNYGSGHPSCVNEDPCTNLAEKSFGFTGSYEQALKDSGLSSSSSDFTVGYSVENVPVKKTVSFGVETGKYSSCVFLDQDQVLGSGLDITAIQGSDIYKQGGQVFYDYLKGFAYAETPAWGTVCDGTDANCVDSMTTLHNTTVHLDDSEEEKPFYIWCKSACAYVPPAPYIIKLKAAFAPPTIPPRILSVTPSSGSSVPYSAVNENVNLFLDIDSTCKYSSIATTTYDAMEGSGTCVGNSDAPGAAGECNFNIPLSLGTTSIYFLCKDVYGNLQTSPTLWSASKSAALNITQTAPSGTLYTNNAVLQVHTSSGGDNGNALCLYGKHGESLQEMYITHGTYHEQSQTSLEKGNYVYDISCTDDIGNKADASISFTIDKDVNAADVSSIYYLGNTLYVITNEASTCQYNTKDFVYGAGYDLGGTASTDHSLQVSDISQVYRIICIDAYGNTMEPVKVDFRYLLSS